MTYSILVSSKALQVYLELLAAAAILLALSRPKWGRSRFTRIESAFSGLSRRQWQAVLIAALFPLAVRAVLLPFFGFPSPRIHDEFSYLLMGDTFAHGRLANPTPPAWQHFETEYELMRPVYASQYQPGQGILLAAGKAFAGHPWWGVWLSVGLMCGALCWALQGFLPPRWALFGALIAALQFGIFGFWMNSYFGGALAATGGALVFGALARRRNSGICGLGLVILLATRPVEALLWGIAVLLRRTGQHAVPLLLTILVGAGGLAYYNSRVTGNPLVPPYLLYRQTYGVPQSYWWQPAVVVSRFDNPSLAANYQNQLALWERRSSPALLWDSTWRRLRDFWRFFIGPFLTLPLLFIGTLWRRPKLRPWLWISALFILDHATYHAWYPQQSAPETVLIILFLVECWRGLRAWRRHTGTGIAITRQLIAAFAIALVAVTAGRALNPHLSPRIRNIWASLDAGPASRDAVIDTLNRRAGKHLVFVHYPPDHRWYDDWVFNDADIPGSRVVFARSLTPESDRELVLTFPGRDVWAADPDHHTLLPYPP